MTLGTIMPVAFDVTDIRVLSFRLEMEFTDEKTARVVRDAIPVYEKVMIASIEGFLSKKFYNDILYVKEKLQRRLQTDFNAKIEGGGRVKKIKFTEFQVQ